MAKQLKAVKCPSDALSLTNCAIVNPREFDKVRHIELSGPSHKFVFTIRPDNLVAPGEIGFSAVQRKWAILAIESKYVVQPFSYDLRTQSISTMTIEADFINKKNSSTEPYDTDKLANDFLQQFGNQAFTVGQQLAYQPADQTKKMLLITVKSIDAVDLGASIEGKAGKANRIMSGQLLPNSSIIFEKAEGSALNFIGKSKGYIFNSKEFNF